MARARSRGAEKLRQAVEGVDGMEVILQPSVESVKIRPAEKRAIRRLPWLGWQLYRARKRKGDAADREEKIKAKIVETMCDVTPGVAGVVNHNGSRTRMRVEVVPNVGREVKNSLAVLGMLRRCKVDVVRSLSLNTADLLANPEKFQQLLDAMIEIYGGEGLEGLLVVDLKWGEYDKALKAGKLPKSIARYIGPSQSTDSFRIDAKPVS